MPGKSEVTWQQFSVKVTTYHVVKNFDFQIRQRIAIRSRVRRSVVRSLSLFRVIFKQRKSSDDEVVASDEPLRYLFVLLFVRDGIKIPSGL